MLERKEAKFHGELGRAVQLDIKAVSASGEFEGYASTFDNMDQGWDIVSKGAFSSSLRRRPASGVKMLWQHDPTEIVGKWLDMKEDDTGLWAEGKILVNLRKGAEVHELMREGAIDGMSIGYRTVKDQMDRETGIRKLLEVDLKEVSIVTFPMNENATIRLVKAGQLPTEREFEQWLTREAGFSAREAKAIISSGFKSLKNERDAGNSDVGLTEALRKLAQTMRG